MYPRTKRQKKKEQRNEWIKRIGQSTTESGGCYNKGEGKACRGGVYVCALESSGMYIFDNSG